MVLRAIATPAGRVNRPVRANCPSLPIHYPCKTRMGTLVCLPGVPSFRAILRSNIAPIRFYFSVQDRARIAALSRTDGIAVRSSGKGPLLLPPRASRFPARNLKRTIRCRASRSTPSILCPGKCTEALSECPEVNPFLLFLRALKVKHSREHLEPKLLRLKGPPKGFPQGDTGVAITGLTPITPTCYARRVLAVQGLAGGRIQYAA